MENPSILNHISIGVRDLDRSRQFYDAVLSPLGCRRIEEMDVATSWGKVFPEFWIGLPLDGQPASSGNGVHIALTAPSREAVDAFYKAALEHGGISDGEPGFRPYAPEYYAAFVRDPDGNKIEAVFLPEFGE
ncbi:MAG: VOC family protein [Cyanobacteria bacterium SID2]|nr:VOC family protein [Cyanobacteria bacterium SID2]MBP0004288.1 VOC family protein [Cyanobacteria bacterium SBC]